MLSLPLRLYTPTRLLPVFPSTRYILNPTSFHRHSTSPIRSKMTSSPNNEHKDEEKPVQLDLSYTKERAEELKENIEEVQREIDEAWEGSEEVEGREKVGCGLGASRRGLGWRS